MNKMSNQEEQHLEVIIKGRQNRSLKQKRILIVDDSKEARDLIKSTLKGVKHLQLTFVGGGSAALVMLKEQKFDLILLDILMPDMDGFEVCTMIRNDPENNGTQIIILSVKDQPDDIIRGLDCGADSYLTKPIDPSELRSRVLVGVKGAQHRQASVKIAQLATSIGQPKVQNKILIVDDDKSTRLLIKNTIQSLENCTIQEVANGAEACEMIQKEKPDLLLLDIKMTGMSGLKVCENIRQDVKNHGVQIMMLTAEKDTQSIITALKFGADEYITKPFDKAELRARVRAALRAARFRQAESQLVTIINTLD